LDLKEVAKVKTPIVAEENDVLEEVIQKSNIPPARTADPHRMGKVGGS
jgi:hypothetical protein